MAEELVIEKVASDPAEEPKKEPETKEAPSADPTLAKELAELRAQVESRDSDLERAKQYIVHLAQQVAKQPAVQSGGKDPKEAFLEALQENPQAALDAHFNARLAPILSEASGNIAQLNRHKAIQSIKEELSGHISNELLQIYVKELDEFMEPFTPDVKARPGSYEDAIKYVRASNISREIEDRERIKKEKENNLEGSSVGGTRAKKEAKPISDVEREIMKGFGLDESEWRKYGG